ncbi:hypothetical protein JXI42_05430 [bacterium]|nr:hypothetical protein [bacterium]
MPTLLKITRAFLYLGLAAALAGIVFSFFIKEPYFLIPFVILAVLDFLVAWGIPKQKKFAMILGIIVGIINLSPVVYNINTGETIVAPINPIIGIVVLVALSGKPGREWFSKPKKKLESST